MELWLQSLKLLLCVELVIILPHSLSLCSNDQSHNNLDMTITRHLCMNLPAWEHFRKHKILLSKLFSFPPTPLYGNGWHIPFLLSKYHLVEKFVPVPMSFSKWHTCGEATLLSTSLGSEMRQNTCTSKWNRNIEHKQRKETQMKMKKWWSSQWMQFMQLRKETWKKIQDFNGLWTRDLAITGAMLYQLSYEAPDVRSRSIARSWVQTLLKSWFFF